jgi:hypothetical protein
MTWHSFREWLLVALFGIVGFFAIRSLDKVEGSLAQVSESVQELNIKIGTVMAVQVHEIEKTRDHETRIRILERK